MGCSAFGPIAGTVPDIAVAMTVLAGQSWPAPEAPHRLRVGVAVNRPVPGGAPDATARLAVTRAVYALRSLGHEVTSVKVPYTPKVAIGWVGCWLAGIAEDVEHLGLALDRLEPRTQWMVRRGRGVQRRQGAELRRLRRLRDEWRSLAVAFLRSCDVLLTPAISRPSPPFGWGASVGFARAFQNGSGVTPYTQAWNLAGVPALSLPFGSDGAAPAGALPGAVQLVSAPGREPDLLALAAQLQSWQPPETGPTGIHWPDLPGLPF